MTTCTDADCFTAAADGAVTGTSVALEQPRLQAAAAAQLDQVRASRTRIVEACDAEQRRLERDLHDGAQQRLVTLSPVLGRARQRAAGADPELAALSDSASQEAAEALTELRELARGLHPAVLTQTGLRGAIQALVERSPVAAAITAVPDGRFPSRSRQQPISSSPRRSPTSPSTRWPIVHTSRSGSCTGGSWCRSAMTEPTVPSPRDPDCRARADRVGSVGGLLRIDSPPGSATRLEAYLPCP